MITVTGSLAFDHIMDFPGKFSDHIMPDKIHQLNLSFLVNTLSKQRGGTAGNIAYNLALLKIPVEVVGTVGVDFLDYAKFLQKAGVDTSQIKTIENNLTSSAFIMTDKSDNQITAFYPGAMDHAASLILDKPTDFAVISPNNPEAMVNFAHQCQKNKIPYMLDPGMQLPALSPESLSEMIKGAEILIGNDYEIAYLSEKCKVKSEKLLEQIKILITTLGEKGSEVKTKADQTIAVSAGKITEAVDPTGAGDAYRGGFLAGYIKKMDLQICGQMGSVAACYAVEKYGTTNHKFTVPEFCERYEESFGTKLEL